MVIYLGGGLLHRSCGALAYLCGLQTVHCLAPAWGLPSPRLSAWLGVSYTSVASLPVPVFTGHRRFTCLWPCPRGCPHR